MSTIVAARRPTDVVQRGGTEGPAPGLIDTLGASFRVAEDDQWIEQEQRLGERYNDLLSTLGDLGVDISREGGLYHYEQSPLPGKLAPQRVPDRDAIMAEVQRQRGRWPDRFGTIGNSREDFERQVATRFGGRARDQQVVRRGNGAVGLLGGLASGMTDPVNIATLPLGAGQASLLRTALVEAAIGAGTEVVNLPGTAAARERMGEDFTATDAVKQVAISGGASAILGSGLRGLEIVAPKVGGGVSAGIDATRLKLETAIADNWDRLPEAVRTRWAKGSPIADADLPDLAETLIGRANMSVDEKGAIDALRREAEIAASSPFKPGAAGEAAHRERLDAATSALLRPVSLGPRGRGLPVRPDMPAPSRAALSSGTALSSASSAPRDALKARIRHVESGGNDVAKNPLSSATGRFQFTRGTWVAYYKRRFGAGGLTDDQIAAKRGDARLQETLMDDLTADNARFLRTVGEAETAGNLYLTHFAGQGGARKLFAADPEASARSVLGGEVVDANPFLARMTAGDVIAWAHRKMQEPPPRRAGARSELAVGEGAWRDRLQMEIDRIDAEADAARAARAGDDPLAAAIEGDGRALPSTDNELVPVDVMVDAADDVPFPAPVARDVVAEGVPEPVVAAIPELRAELAERGEIDIAELSRRFDLAEDEARRLADRVTATQADLVAVADGELATAPLRAARDGFQRQVDAELAALPDTSAPSAAGRDRVDSILAAPVDAGAALPISATARQFVDELKAPYAPGAFSASDADLIATVGRRIAAVDGAKVADRVHMAEAASYVDAQRMARDSDDVIEVGDFDPSSKWERPDDPVAIAQADSVRHDLDVTITPEGGATFFLDEDGAGRSWGDIADELDADDAELEAVRACL